jgi:hypothetical protein
MATKGTDKTLTIEQLTTALGKGAVEIWSDLPAEIQHELFEAAIACHGEELRHDLALFLHERHARTDPQGRSTQESDRFGG